jgi:hypothetical protein
MSTKNSKSDKEPKIIYEINDLSEGIEVLHDLTESLHEKRFDNSNSIIVKSIKTLSKEIKNKMKEIYERHKVTQK